MAIDSIGSQSATLTALRDTISSIRGADSINRITPTENDPNAPRPGQNVEYSNAAITDVRVTEQQSRDALRQGLSSAVGTGAVALAGAQSVSGTLDEIGSRLQQLTDTTLSADRRTALAGEINNLVDQGLQTVDQANFNGVNLLDANNTQNLEVATDRNGGTATIRDQNLRTTLEGLQNLDLTTPRSAQSVLETSFADARTNTDNAITALTQDTRQVGERAAAVQQQQADQAADENQQVDTTLQAQTAQQAAAQVQVALSGQNLGIVNQRPEFLSGLFR